MNEAGPGGGREGITNPYIVRVLTPLEKFSTEPCFRNTFLWGIAAGALMGVHRARVGSECNRVVSRRGAATVYFCVQKNVGSIIHVLIVYVP